MVEHFPKTFASEEKATTTTTSVDPLDTALARALILPLSDEFVASYRAEPDRHVATPLPLPHLPDLLSSHRHTNCSMTVARTASESFNCLSLFLPPRN